MGASMSGGTVSRNLAKGAVLALTVGLTLLLLGGALRSRLEKPQQPQETALDSEAEMTLKGMEYTELQGGKRVWTLRAAEAKYFQEEQKTLLASVQVTFFLDSGDKVLLESQEGVLYAGSKDIEMWNAVRASLPGGYDLATDHARYDHRLETVLSESVIQLGGPDIQAQGKQWSYRIREGIARVEGGVTGSLVLSPSKSAIP